MPMYNKTIITGEKIYARSITFDDIDNGWLTWVNDPLICKYLETSPPINRESLIDYFEKSQPPEHYMFAVCLKNSDQYIGNARLHSIDYKKKQAFYGRLIGLAGFRGQGIGTELLGLIAKFAFEYLELDIIKTGVRKNNIGSINSNIKAGFIEDFDSELSDDKHESSNVVNFFMTKEVYGQKKIMDDL